jgi:hypothetical protein
VHLTDGVVNEGPVVGAADQGRSADPVKPLHQGPGIPRWWELSVEALTGQMLIRHNTVTAQKIYFAFESSALRSPSADQGISADPVKPLHQGPVAGTLHQDTSADALSWTECRICARPTRIS